MPSIFPGDPELLASVIQQHILHQVLCIVCSSGSSHFFLSYLATSFNACSSYHANAVYCVSFQEELFFLATVAKSLLLGQQWLTVHFENLQPQK